MTHWRQRFYERKHEVHNAYVSYKYNGVGEERVKHKLAKLIHTTWQHYDD